MAICDGSPSKLRQWAKILQIRYTVISSSREPHYGSWFYVGSSRPTCYDNIGFCSWPYPVIKNPNIAISVTYPWAVWVQLTLTTLGFKVPPYLWHLPVYLFVLGSAIYLSFSLSYFRQHFFVFICWTVRYRQTFCQSISSLSFTNHKFWPDSDTFS